MMLFMDARADLRTVEFQEIAILNDDESLFFHVVGPVADMKSLGQDLRDFMDRAHAVAVAAGEKLIIGIEGCNTDRPWPMHVFEVIYGPTASICAPWRWSDLSDIPGIQYTKQDGALEIARLLRDDRRRRVLVKFSLGRTDYRQVMRELRIDGDEALLAVMAGAGLPMPKLAKEEP